MKRRAILLLTTFVLAVGLAGGWLLGRNAVAPQEAVSGAERQPDQTIPVVVKPAPRPTAPAASSPGQQASVALDSLPVIEMVPHLEARARQGDGASACRLGAALLHCVRFNDHGVQRLFVDPLSMAAASEKEQERMINAAARLEERAERTAMACKGITREQHYLAGLHSLLAAATRGEVAARRQFVMESPAVTDLLQFPEIGALYMANAPRFFSDMWREGDPAAIEVLHSSAAPSGPAARQAPWMAIPPALRSRQLARDLWTLRVLATSDNPHYRPPPPLPNEPPPDPAITAQAQAYWSERFEHSPHVAAEREARARQKIEWETDLMRQPLIRDPCAD